MANFYDYLAWRGDLSFAQAPLNEVDNVILSWLSYADWAGAVPGPGQGAPVRLCDAAARLFSLRPRPVEKDAAFSINAAVTGLVMADRVADVPRFSSLRLCGYVNEIDAEKQMQFSAVTLLGPDWAFVSYRGTDSTFVGWREDCCLSLSEAVPAQLAAVDYLGRVPELAGRELYLGGHSKGGNLAVYAGVKCAPEYAARIRRIFNNDGPGFTRAFIQGEDFRRMHPLIHTIIPQSSVVGMLLEHKENYAVVKSAQVSVLQHNAVYWEVLGPGFVRARERTGSSLVIDQGLRKWMSTLDDGQRRRFIDALFTTLEATGATRIEELGAEGLPGFFRALRALSDLKEEQKRMLLRAARGLVRLGNQALYQTLFK